jgi:hypothetical protein
LTLFNTDLIGSFTLVAVGFVPQFSDICKGYYRMKDKDNHAAVSPWLRCSWSPNYSVLVCGEISQVCQISKKKSIYFYFSGIFLDFFIFGNFSDQIYVAYAFDPNFKEIINSAQLF